MLGLAVAALSVAVVTRMSRSPLGSQPRFGFAVLWIVVRLVAWRIGRLIAGIDHVVAP
jgi:hypothetical protein